MRHRLRHLWASLAAASLLLGVAAMACWTRSYHHADIVAWGSLPRGGTAADCIDLCSVRGTLQVTYDHLAFDGPAQAIAQRAAESFPDGRDLRWQSRDAAEAYVLTEHDTFGERRGFCGDSLHEEDTAPEAGSGIKARYDWRQFTIPWWLPTALALVWPLAWLVNGYLRRIQKRNRLRRGQCRECGYDLRASPATCPECGTPVAADQTLSGASLFTRRRAVAGLTVMLLGVCLFLILRRAVTGGLSGRPSWLAIGGTIYQERDLEEAEKQVLELDDGPMWFVTSSRLATLVEQDVYQQREVTDKQWKIVNIPNVPQPLPAGRQTPLTPQELPLEDRGVSLSLDIRPGGDPSLLDFGLSLASRDHPVWREVEHRWTDTLPFLFAFYVDGKAIVVPDIGWTKSGGIQRRIDLVPQGGRRDWSLRVKETGLRKLLPNSGPHTLVVVAAFGQRQYEREVGYYGLMELDSEPDSDPGEKLIEVRSNSVRLKWTGSRWLVEEPTAK